MWRVAVALAAIVGGILVSRQISYAAECPSEVQNTPYCDAFFVYKKPGTSKSDWRIEKLIPKAKEDDADVRSFAFVVSVYNYPAFTQEKDKVLQSVKADLPRIEAFLKDQGFDEVIVLDNEHATKDAINYFLEQYLLTKVNDYKGRSRFLFMYDGHGIPGADDRSPGGLALSMATGEADPLPAHSYGLDDLENRLRKIAHLTYHSVALLGSCYSGGVFPINTSLGDNTSFPLSPGAHAVTASKADELAWGAPDGKGTMFFEKLIAAIDRGASDLNSSQVVSSGNGQPQKVAGSSIVRLGRAVQEMNESLEVINPATNQYYPQLRTGPIAPEENYDGAFFFLVPPRSEQQANNRDPNPATTIQRDFDTTGSAVSGRPDLKVFSPPETYAVRGIDIARYTGDLKFDAIKASGLVKFIYAKATQGSEGKDTKFPQFMKGAGETGVSFGGYHVFDCSPPEAQFKNITAMVPRDKDLLPVAVDLEWFRGNPHSLFLACSDNPDVIRSNLKALLSELADYYGKRPIVYTSRFGVGDILRNDFNDFGLWYADFRKTTPGYAGDNPWTFWQMTDHGNIPGVTTAVDYNVFFGSKEQFAAFAETGENVARNAAVSLK
ncbi:GH25 family lysozyme [Rhizobium leguminosarum]|nr:GH25 family lysozyme [Rhizobium leguminosarum]